MTQKHSPGPWKCEPSSANDLSYVVTDEDGNVLTYDDAEHEANARLIEQAPEIYDLLRDMLAGAVGEYGLHVAAQSILSRIDGDTK